MQNPGQTIISEYATSPTIGALIASMNVWIDPSALVDAFYADVWNILIAQGYGLDVWGRILGFGRVIQVQGDQKYFGFQQGGSVSYDTFSFAPFFSGQTTTQNFALLDPQYRLALLAKAATNISSCGIPAINAILLALFPARGDVHVTDGLNMTMTYHFGFRLSLVEAAIVSQPGLLPKPAGVSATIVTP